jgi:hypothetical protein
MDVIQLKAAQLGRGSDLTAGDADERDRSPDARYGTMSPGPVHPRNRIDSPAGIVESGQPILVDGN